MPIQNPPQTEDQSAAAWSYEATAKINELEQRLSSLLQLIKSSNYTTLQDKVKKL